MDDCRNCANMDNEYCFACDNGNQFKPMTNGNRIRSMSDEELAVFLCKIIDNCAICVGRDTCTFGRNGTIDWLKQEAE